MVRRVEGLAAAVSLLVDRAAGFDEGGDVSDRVVYPEPVVGALDVKRLVEVHRARWVDRDERDVGAVELGELRVGGSLLGGLQHLGRELRRDPLVPLDRRHPRGERGAVLVVQVDAASRHEAAFLSRVDRLTISP